MVVEPQALYPWVSEEPLAWVWMVGCDQIGKLPVTEEFYTQCSAVYDWVQHNQNLLTSTGNPDYM